MAFEKYFLPESGQKKMAIHLFKAILSEYLAGEKTAIQCKEAMEWYLDTTLTKNEISDITSVVNYIDNGPDYVSKVRRMDELYRICVLAEHDIWYNTQELLRARLNWVAE